MPADYTDAEGTIWVGEDEGDVAITAISPTLTPTPGIDVTNLPNGKTLSPDIDVPVPAALPTATVPQSGVGAYIAFSEDGEGVFIVMQNSLAGLIDGFRLK